MLVLLAAEAELVAEHVQQHQHHDDQQNDGEYSAAPAAAGFHEVVVRVRVPLSSAMETLPVFPVMLAKRTNCCGSGSDQEVSR